MPIFKQVLILLLALFFKLVDVLSNLRIFNPFSKADPGLVPFSKFQDLPSELLSAILDEFLPREKLVFSRVCKHWNKVIIGSKANWRFLHIGESEDIQRAIHILNHFTELSEGSLRVVFIEVKIDEPEDLMEILEILEESWEDLRVLHLAQDPSLNTMTREFARDEYPRLAVLSTQGQRYNHPRYFEKFTELTSVGEETSSIKRVKKKSETDSDGSELRKYYTNSLMDIEEEDLEWMNQVEVLSFSETDSASSFYKVLLNVKDSIKQLHLIFYHIDDFEKEMTNKEPIIEFPFLEFMACSLFVPDLFPSNWFFPSLTGLGGNSSSLSGKFDPQTLQQLSHLELSLAPFQMESLHVSDVLESSNHLKSLVQFLFSNPKENHVALEDLLVCLELGPGDSGACPSLSHLHLVASPDDLQLDSVIKFKRRRDLFLNRDREGTEEKVFNVTFDSPKLTARFEELLKEDSKKKTVKV